MEVKRACIPLHSIETIDRIISQSLQSRDVPDPLLQGVVVVVVLLLLLLLLCSILGRDARLEGRPHALGPVID